MGVLCGIFGLFNEITADVYNWYVAIIDIRHPWILGWLACNVGMRFAVAYAEIGNILIFKWVLKGSNV